MKKQLKKINQEFEIYRTLAVLDLKTATELMKFAKEEPICITPKEKDVEKVEALLYVYFVGDARWSFIESNKIDEKSTLSESFMKLYKERKQLQKDEVLNQIEQKAKMYEF